jgi:hypothetical protein
MDMARCTTVLLTLGWLLAVQVVIAGGTDAQSPASNTKLNASAVGELRTWTDSTGTRTIQAEYLGSSKQQVTLRLENGKKLTLRINQLSDSDQQFVREASEAKRSPKPAVGKATTTAASIVSDIPAANEKNLAAKAPFALCDIQIGMTDREVARVFKRKELQVSEKDVEYDDSAMNKFAGARKQQFVTQVKAYRVDVAATPTPVPSGFRESRLFPKPPSHPVVTRIEVGFKEDLPDRPGVGVCTSVDYSKQLEGNPNLGPLAQQAIDDLIARHGRVNKETTSYVIFGDENGRCLKVYRDFIDIELSDAALEKRLEDAKKKIEAIDARPIATNAGSLDY